MGLYDREYYRSDPSTGVRRLLSSALWTIVVLNVVIWIAQVFTSSPKTPSPVTDFLACQPHDLFGGFPQIWKLVTACFAHSVDRPEHLFFNMFMLYIFGRDLEALYGRRDFFILYLTAGALSVAAEAIVQQIAGNPAVFILGASGSVMALVVLLTTFYPRRRFGLFFFPMLSFPLWGLCVFYVVMDLLGVFSPNSGVANVAHLAGAAFGFCYRFYDLRWANVRKRLPAFFTRKSSRKPPRGWKVIEKVPPRREQKPEVDQISTRIDELLAKISEQGKESLTDEEWQFLMENSKKYKNPP